MRNAASWIVLAALVGTACVPPQRSTGFRVVVRTDVATLEPAVFAHVTEFFGSDHVRNRYVNDSGYCVIDDGLEYRIDFRSGTDGTASVEVFTRQAEAGKTRIAFRESLRAALASKGFEILR